MCVCVKMGSVAVFLFRLHVFRIAHSNIGNEVETTSWENITMISLLVHRKELHSAGCLLTIPLVSVYIHADTLQSCSLC